MAPREDIKAPGPSPLVLAVISGPPLLAAMAAMPLLLFFIMGASAFAGTARHDLFNASLYVLMIYPALYTVLAGIQILSAWRKWPMVNLLHTLIWLSFAGFAGFMSYAWIILTSP